MIAVTPLLHEIIPHGWTRIALFEPDYAVSGGYSEHPELLPLYRERHWRLFEDLHNSAELATKIWLGQQQDEAGRNWHRAG